MIRRDFLTEPADPAPIALFRIFFGFLMGIEVLRYWAYGRIERYYIEPEFLFPFVEGIGSVGEGMYLVFVLMGVSAVFLAIGFHYRAASIVFFILYTYTFLLDKAQYNNHYYLICLLGFLFVMTDSHRTLSVDAWRRNLACRVPAWQVHVFRLQFCIVFLYAGIAKLNPDWLAGEPVRSWLAAKSHYFAIGPLLVKEWFVYLYAYAGLVFDLCIGFMLLWPPTRSIGLVLLIGFNFLNKWFYNIGIFPYLTVAAFAVFMDASTIRSIPHRWSESGIGRRTASLFRVLARRRSGSRARGYVVLVFVLLQLLVPLRHFLIPGNVSWTDEGHNFSWRMKLRDKSVREIRFFTKDPHSGRIRELSTEDLTRRQKMKMAARPHMILQYARHLAERLRQEGIDSPAIYARALVSLNSGETRPLIDQSVNLAEAEYKLFGHNDWITLY
ncbi:MAG: HTTM domain-containing protein [Candidatus Aminicenantes bacterium]|nr:HTTM domain-containing protein [Candidatus Aminicenantes bacterium]